MTDYHIRWMIRRDMPAVLNVEHESFQDTWTEKDFLDHLRQASIIGLVAEKADELVGFVIYKLHSPQTGTHGRIEILNFAVHPAFRRQGVGRAMVDKLKRKLSRDHRNRLGLYVREANLDAQLFFKACGFRAISIIKGYYEDSDEPAYLMQCRCAVPEVVSQ